jgi:hypothetical protein
LNSVVILAIWGLQVSKDFQLQELSAERYLIGRNHHQEEKRMKKEVLAFSLVFMLLATVFTAVSVAQEFPIMNRVADKVIQKYQNSSCEQLWQERGQPKPPMEQEAVQLLQGNPQMRQAFIDKVAAPIANKMFECGMIP